MLSHAVIGDCQPCTVNISGIRSITPRGVMSSGSFLRYSPITRIYLYVPKSTLFETQVSKTDPRAEPVTVSIKTIHPDMVSDSIEYSVGDEEHWQQYGEPFAVEENTIIYYRAQDTSGNMTEVQTLTISNIDKNPPILKLNLTGDAEGGMQEM